MTDELTPQEQQFFATGGEQAPEAPAAETPAEPEPELVLEAEPEAPAAPAAEPAKPAEEKHQTVPLAVLMEERAKAKEWRAQLEQERVQRAAEQAKLQERLDILARAYQPKEEQPPAFEDDPVAATRYGLQKTGESLQEVAKQVAEVRQRQEAEEFERRITAAAVSAEQQFKAQAPDYDAAIEHLVRQRAGELSALGYQGPQILQVMQNERAALLQQTLANGRNPAQTLYELAKVRGYAPKPVAPAPEAKLETLQAGAKAAAGIDNVAGRQQKSISVQSLIEMDDDQFAKIAGNEKAWRRLFGE